MVREVEPRLVGVDERALLLHVLAQHLAQRLMHEMRRRVVAHRAPARLAVDGGGHTFALAQLAGPDLAHVPDDIRLDLLRILHVEKRQARAAFRELAAITHLAARFRIERRAVEDHDAALADGERIDAASAAIERDHARFLGQRFVAPECRLRTGVRKRLAGLELRSGARAFALRVHRTVEARRVDADPAFARDVRREVEREPVRIVERECGIAVDDPHAAAQRLAKHAHAVLERFAEALLLGLQHLRDTRAVAAQLRIGVAHFAVEIANEPMEERLLLPELVAMADRAPDDAPQDVAATFAARHHAVDDQECAGADVIGDHLERRAVEIGACVSRAAALMSVAKRSIS